MARFCVIRAVKNSKFLIQDTIRFSLSIVCFSFIGAMYKVILVGVSCTGGPIILGIGGLSLARGGGRVAGGGRGRAAVVRDALLFHGRALLPGRHARYYTSYARHTSYAGYGARYGSYARRRGHRCRITARTESARTARSLAGAWRRSW